MNSHGADGITTNIAETKENKKKKETTDADLQKKSVKLVVMHLKKKVDPDAAGIDRVLVWLGEMEELLEKCEFLVDFKAVKEGNVWCTTNDMYQQSLSIGFLLKLIMTPTISFEIGNAPNNATMDNKFFVVLVVIYPTKNIASAIAIYISSFII